MCADGEKVEKSLKNLMQDAFQVGKPHVCCL